MVASIIDRFNTAKPSGGINVAPGIYDITLGKMKLITSWDKENEYFIVNILIDESSNPSRPKGSQMDWVCKITDKFNRGMSDVRQFLANVVESTFAEISADVLNAAVSPGQPLEGIRMRLTAVELPPKEGRKPFTKCAWQFLCNGPKQS